MLASLKSTMVKPKQQRLREAIAEYQRVVKPMVDSDAIPIKPQRIMKELSKVLGPRDIVVSDTGYMICWTTRFLRLKGTGMTYIPCGGTLGSSFPLAIGASFGASEDQRVLNLIGDGGIAYNLAELETAKRYKDQHVPFVALVSNNSSLAQPRAHLDDLLKKTDSWINCCDFSELDYSRIAESFGCYGVRVEKPEDIAEAVQEAFEAGRPAIVDVVTDKREYAPIGLPRGIRKEPSPGIPTY
jgi:acetolactate synthase-1/2/3 large subunit